jgi:hypothetical protein
LKSRNLSKTFAVLRVNNHTNMKPNFKSHGFSYLGSVNSSSKIMKSNKVLDIDTFILYLAPTSLSGHNVCPKATKECINGCLNTSGRAIGGVHSYIVKARINKTKFFYDQRERFNEVLFKEVKLAKGRSERKGKQFVVRLNGTSDLNPILFKSGGKNILETFPDVQFYDYTKILNRIELTKKHLNYDLTFSFTGHNWSDCLIALENNVRVATIFNIKVGQPLPESFNGFTVVDGDKYDYRPIDEKNVIVGLRWKNIANKQVNNEIRNSAFVVQP